MHEGQVCDADRQEWAHELARQLGALSPMQRAAIRLIYNRGLVVADVAVELKLTVSDASAVVAEALQTLGRTILSDVPVVLTVRSSAK